MGAPSLKKNVVVDWRVFFDEKGEFHNEEARKLFNQLCTAYCVTVLLEHCFTLGWDYDEQKRKIEDNLPKIDTPALIEIENARNYVNILKGYYKESPTLFMYTEKSATADIIARATKANREPGTLYSYKLDSLTYWSYQRLFSTFFPSPLLPREGMSPRAIITCIFFGIALAMLIAGIALMAAGAALSTPLTPVSILFFIGVGLALGTIIPLVTAMLCSPRPTSAMEPAIEAPAIRGFMAYQPSPS